MRAFDPLAVELALRGGAAHPDATPARVLHALGHENALPVCELEPGAAAEAVRMHVATGEGIPLVAGEAEFARGVVAGLRDRGVEAVLVRPGDEPPAGAPIHVHVDGDVLSGEPLARALRRLLEGHELAGVSVAATLEEDGAVSPDLVAGMAPILDA